MLAGDAFFPMLSIPQMAMQSDCSVYFCAELLLTQLRSSGRSTSPAQWLENVKLPNSNTRIAPR